MVVGLVKHLAHERVPHTLFRHERCLCSGARGVLWIRRVQRKGRRLLLVVKEPNGENGGKVLRKDSLFAKRGGRWAMSRVTTVARTAEK